jgi:hypothetical protein
MTRVLAGLEGVEYGAEAIPGEAGGEGVFAAMEPAGDRPDDGM